MQWREIYKLKNGIRFAKPTKADVHHFVHSGESWAHRAYLLCVAVEVKYWYGTAAIVVLVLECVLFFCREVDE